jgi:hypothetical protein
MGEIFRDRSYMQRKFDAITELIKRSNILPKPEIILNDIEEQVDVLPPTRFITREDNPEIFDRLEQYFGQQDAEQ